MSFSASATENLFVNCVVLGSSSIMEAETSSILNPVLAFVKAYCVRNDLLTLKQLALGRFSPTMLFEAKKLLWNRCSLSESFGLPFATRRSTERRTQAAADLDDIISAFVKLDETSDIPSIFCEALDLVQMPPVVADPVAEKIHENNQSIKSLEEKLQQLSSNISGILSSISTVESNLSVLSASTTKSSSSASYAEVTAAKSCSKDARAPSHSSFSVPRNSNLILFGLPTTSSLPELKEKVNDILHFLVGTSVPLRDLYRLRQKKPSPHNSASRPRPVILIFDSIFDRRLVLSSVRKLKEYSVKGLFLRADLPLDIRVKRQSTNKSDSPANRETSTHSVERSISPKSILDGGSATEALSS